MTLKSYQHWKLTIDESHILWLTIDRQHATVNSLSREVIEELDAILDDIINAVDELKSLRGVIILSGKTSGFIAGADIEQFVALEDQKQAFDLIHQAQQVFNKLADLKIPTLAMIKGFCLGGGLELALACRYRVAEEGPNTQLGAPEVKLGIHPGWGGTVRLPALIGVLPAMDMNLSGRAISAKAAAKIGLVDVAVPQRELVRAARYYILHKPSPHHPAFFQEALAKKWLKPLVAKILYRKLTPRVNKAHYPAPYAIIDNWEKDGSESQAMTIEAQSIAQLLLTETSRNLVRVFFLQTRMKAIGKEVQFKPAHVHVIGAGMMGGDIAAWCALRGLRVTLQDQLPELIAPAIKRAFDLFQKKLKSPLLVRAAMDRLTVDERGLGVSEADVVIEAIFENLSAKQALYQTIEASLKPGALLATNTSSLSLEELSQGLKNPQRLVGIHFFNPVAMMQLVEVVHAKNTDPEMVDKAIAFVRKIDRLPLPVQSRPGFLVNRILMPYLIEAMLLFEEGVPASNIDKAAVDFGMPVGPIQLADAVGLDVCLAVGEILANHYGNAVPKKLREMVERGDLGRKSGKGFYTYQKGKPVKEVASDRYEHHPNITHRLIFRMLNEAVACWREQIAADGDLVDAGMIFGTGFAPFRGGPLHYVKSQGVSATLETLKGLYAKEGERFKPDEGWAMLPPSIPLIPLQAQP